MIKGVVAISRKGVFSGVALVLIIILAGCQENINLIVEDSKDVVVKKEQSDEGATGLPTSPIKLKLSLTKPPELEQTAELNVTITRTLQNKLNETYALVNITLPEGFELISGNLTWNGSLEPLTNLNIVIKSVETGNWTIEASVRTPPTGDTWFGGKDFLYITVLENTAMLSETPFPELYEPCEENYFEGELVQCNAIIN